MKIKKKSKTIKYLDAIKIPLVLNCILLAILIVGVYTNGFNIAKGLFGGKIPNPNLQTLVAETNLCRLESFDQLDQVCRVKIPQNIKLGVYDPDGIFDNFEKVKIEHIYTSWTNLENFRQQIENLKESNREVYLTVEPWPTYENELGPETLFEDITMGSYDDQIFELCSLETESIGKFYLSWGHEMDQLLTERYPWSGTDSEGYIDAYKYFVNKCDQQSNNFIYVWSPVGNENLSKYYPGSNYVDAISLPVYSYPEFDTDYYGKARTFDEAFSGKYELVKNFNKPVIISEMGVYSNNKNYKQVWFVNSFNEMHKYELLETAIIFNSRDSEGAWGENYSTPDWRISPEIFMDN